MTRSELIAAYRAGLITAERTYHLLCNLSFNRYPHA